MVSSSKCSECAHNQVCAFRSEFEAAVTTIGETTYTHDNVVTFFKNSPIDITVFCPHYMGKVSYR